MSRTWVRLRRSFAEGMVGRLLSRVPGARFVVVGLPVLAILVLLGMAWRGESAARRVEAGWSIVLNPDVDGPPWLPRAGRGTNASGFHDVERTQLPAAGVSRVIVVGDALTWGMQVPRDATFTRVAEDILRGEGRSIEILNFGVPGYDIDAAARMILSVVPGWAPARIVYAFSSDDAHPRMVVHPDTVGSVRFVGLTPPAGVESPDRWLLAHSAWMRQRFGQAAEAAWVPMKANEADRVHHAVLSRGVTELVAAAGATPLSVFTLAPAALAGTDISVCNERLHSRYGCAWHAEQITEVTHLFGEKRIPVTDGLTAIKTLSVDVVSFGDDDPDNVSIAGHAALGAALADALRQTLPVSPVPP